MSYYTSSIMDKERLKNEISENESTDFILDNRVPFVSSDYMRSLSEAITIETARYKNLMLSKADSDEHNDNEEDCTEDDLEWVFAKEPRSEEKNLSEINWRTGPARLWYDYMGVPADATSIDYGFKVKTEEIDEQNQEKCFPDEAFLMVTQQPWENDVIWDSSLNREKIMSKLQNPSVFTGWAVKKFSNQYYNLDSGPLRNGNVIPATFRQDFLQKSRNCWYSSLPLVSLENEKEVWEDRVIWDASAMIELPQPSVSYVVSADYFQETMELDSENAAHDDIDSSNYDVCRLSDRFNISNDNFYDYDDPRDYTRRPHFLAIIQHADVVLRFEHPYIMVNVTTAMSRTFHRNLLASRPSNHYTATQQLRAISTYDTHIDPIEADPDQTIRNSVHIDLTGLDGDILLVEWAEQFPLFLNQVGMCSTILNYFKRNSSKKSAPEAGQFRYGCTAFVHQTPFIAEISPGSYCSALENNMYRAPIYEHQIPNTDFLIIKRKNDYFVREFNALFVAGRQNPFTQIPSPTSLETKDIKNNILLVYIFRLFRKSPYNPQVISMSDLKKKFPSVPEQMYRTKLNMCATYRKVDHDGLTGFHWVLKPDFRIPTETEMQCMVSPEQYCAYFSMLAAHQRLKDIGLGCKFFMRDSHKQYLESELSKAPWNITNNHLTAMRTGNIRFNLDETNETNASVDSFSKSNGVLKKILEPKENMTVKEASEFLKLLGVSPAITKKLSTWDILDAARTAKRNLQSNKFQKFYKKAIDLFNKHIGQNNSLEMSKKARYKREIQRTFEIQKSKLSAWQILSSDNTDESSTSTGEEEEIERLGKLVEYRLTNKQPSEEKAKLKKLKRKRFGPEFVAAKKVKRVEPTHVNAKPDEILQITRTVTDRDGREVEHIEFIRDQRVINMYMAIRTTKDKKFIDEFIGADDLKKRRERKSSKPKTPRRSELKMENGRPKTYVKKQQTTIDGVEQDADSKKKKSLKVKIVPPLKINLNKPVEVKPAPSTYVKKKVTPIKQESVEIVCVKKGYQPRNSYKRRDPVVMFCGILDEILVKVRKEMFAKPFLVAVNPKHYPDYYIKIKTPMDLLSIYEKIRNQNYTTREMFLGDINQMVENSTIYNGLESCFTKDAIKVLDACVEKLSEREEDLIELEKMINPLLDHDQAAISFIFTNVLNKLRVLPDSRPFWKPVDKLKYKDYYDIIKNPMDMDTIAKNLKEQSYQSAAQFISEFELIALNADIYNGPESSYSQCARGLLKSAIESLTGVKDYIAVLEENIKRLNIESEVQLMSMQNDPNIIDSNNDKLETTKKKYARKNKKIIITNPDLEPDSSNFPAQKAENDFMVVDSTDYDTLEICEPELGQEIIIEEYITNSTQGCGELNFYVRNNVGDQIYNRKPTSELFESIDIEEIQF